MNAKKTLQFAQGCERARAKGEEAVSMVQATVNIAIFRKKCAFNFINRPKPRSSAYGFARRVVRSFVDRVPPSAAEFVGLEREREFISVGRARQSNPRRRSSGKATCWSTSASSSTSSSSTRPTSGC